MQDLNLFDICEKKSDCEIIEENFKEANIIEYSV